MIPIDAWNVLIDLGCVSLLLLVGQGIRATVPLVQRFFIPASVIAGINGLVLGPNGFNLLPFSSLLFQYPSVLITLIFAALPFASHTFRWQAGSRRVGELWTYSATTMLLQWGLGLLFGLVVLRLVWPELPRGFGTLLASGFVGGHGTAAAVGAAFAERGWPEAGSLAMTAATVGIVSSIVGGMLWIQWGAKAGVTRFVARFEELPQELRTGLVPPDKRTPLGYGTVSAIVIDPLIFHVALIAAAAAGGFWVGQWSADYLGPYRLPTFGLAFVSGIVFRQVLIASHAFTYVDRHTAARLCGALTDVLVVCGIAAIDLQVVTQYAYPLVLLFTFGILLCWSLFRFCGPQVFEAFWFEKSLYTWGWVTGILALAIALLRIVDPDNEAAILDDFALAYIALGPLEALLVTLAPMLVAQGYVWSFALCTTGGGFLVLVGSLWARRSRSASTLGGPHR